MTIASDDRLNVAMAEAFAAGDRHATAAILVMVRERIECLHRASTDGRRSTEGRVAARKQIKLLQSLAADIEARGEGG